MENDKQISIAKIGMKRDAHPGNLNEQDLSFALNSNVEDENNSGGLNRMLEHSNLLCSKFKSGFKVVGYRLDIDTDRVWFMLTHPITKTSEIGYIENISGVIDTEMMERQCGCDYSNILALPLEQQEQIEGCQYVTALSDACNKCLGFDVTKPIQSILIKEGVLYFAQPGTDLRYFDSNNIEQYKFKKFEKCDEEAVLNCSEDPDCNCEECEDTCPDCSKLKVFKDYSIPCIKPTVMDTGGNLPQATYRYLIAFCDSAGNEISEYFSPTNAIPVFDIFDNIQQQPELNKQTNYAIKLEIENLDESFDYFKMAVFTLEALQSTAITYTLGVFPTSTKTVVHSSLDVSSGRSINTLQQIKPKFKSVEGIVRSANRMFAYGLEKEADLNLQPVVNLMSAFLRWQIGVAKENLYQNGIEDSKYTGYLRNENYSFAIQFESSDGDISPLFPLTHRPSVKTGVFATNEEFIVIEDGAPVTEGLPENTELDLESLLEKTPDCVTTRNKKWQFYNTASITSSECAETLDTKEIQIEEPISCESVVIGSTEPGEITVTTLPENFTSLVGLGLEYFEPGGELEDEFMAIYLNPREDLGCSVEDVLGDDCELKLGEDSLPILTMSTYISGIEDEVITENTLPTSSYSRSTTNVGCQSFQKDNEGNVIADTEFTSDYPAVTPVYKRNILSNLTCTTALEVLPTPSIPLFVNYFGTGETAARQLLSSPSIELPCVSGVFLNNLHKNAIWVKVNFNGQNKTIFEVTKESGCENVDIFSNNQIRVTTYNSCVTPSATTSRYIILTNSTGTLNVEIAATPYALTYNTSVSQTFTDFISTHGATILSTHGLTVTTSGDRLIFTGNTITYPTLVVVNNTLTAELKGDAITCNIVDLSLGEIIELNRADFSSDEVYIAIDTPIENNAALYYLPPSGCGCFSVLQRPVEILSYTISYFSVETSQINTFIKICTYNIPQVDECKVVPFLEGKFGYWESIRTYPDNAELYDSSNLVIDNTKIPTSIKTEFENYFTDGITIQGNYILNDETNLRCKPIRHYKMPNNDIAPFMFNSFLPEFNESIIFPLGVKIDNEIINAFLDIAVDNNLLTKERRDKLTSYKIYRGDRRLDKSIIAKGLLYDVYDYRDQRGEVISYPNYPYNSLGSDALNFTDTNRDTLIPHPYDSLKNTRFTFHSPEFHFNSPKPALPTEIEYEGYLYGRSRGRFDQVEDHPKYVILGKQAYNLATTLGTLEYALEQAIIIGQAYVEYAKMFYTEAGVTVGQNIPGITSGGIYIGVMVSNFLLSAPSKIGKYRFEWLKIFRENGSLKNFVYKYASEGWYNSMSYEHGFGQKLRGVDVSKFLKGGGRYSILERSSGTTLKFNNEDRESSLFLSLGGDPTKASQFLNYTTKYKDFDNYSTNRGASSRRVASDLGALDNAEFGSNIASPYVSLKNFIADQYGDLNSIKWLPTGYCGRLSEDNKCDTIYGGDIRITRMSLKRKLPLFLVSAMGQANLTPFAYSLYPNIGVPKFYANFDIELTDGFSLSNIFFPDLGSEYNLDRFDNRFYIKEPSRMYLQYYGIPQFLCESEINCHFRYSKNEPHEWFYPNGGASDYNWWTQEKNVPIRRDNTYFYNFVYSTNFFFSNRTVLPVNYSKEVWEKISSLPNTVIASLPDETASNVIDPWLLFKPSDIYEFKESAGKLYELKDIESEQMLGRFKNQMMLLNSIDILRERLAVDSRTLGTGIFGQRPIEFKRADLGIFGTQQRQSLATPYGYFWTDAKRGGVIWVDSSGKSPIDCAKTDRSGKPSEMSNWFREQLPFKILKGVNNITEDDVDNGYNRVGIVLGWDDRFSRVFITKKDYVVKAAYKNQINYVDGNFFYGNTMIDLTNTDFFEDASWTVAYSPKYQMWISYYSFAPNYYISHQNYFQTGINNSVDSKELGLWSHLLTNQSFNVFYGKKYPFILEYPVASKINNKVLQSIEYVTDVRKYINKYDFTTRRDIGFDTAYIYNSVQTSGKLNLITQEPNNRFQKTSYPKFNPSSIDILQTPDDGKWTFNHFFNIRNSLSDNQPLWKVDVNNINREINNKSLSYINKANKDRMRGDWFLVRLEYFKDSRYQFSFRWNMSKSHGYQ